MNEYAIGSTHDHNGNLVECIEVDGFSCVGCSYIDTDCSDIRCIPTNRCDKKSVIFKKVEG